jgi:hypothetical protein
MASGHVNRTKGRTHGCTDQLAGVKKVLANSEPSTHVHSATCRDEALRSACGVIRTLIMDDRGGPGTDIHSLEQLVALQVSLPPFQ